MSENQEPIEVEDRRSGAAPAEGEQPAGGEAAGTAEAPEMSAEEAAREAGEQAAAAGPTDVRALLSMTVAMLAESAWVKLGLRADPLTGKIERDLEQARLAIDCLSDLTARLSPSQDEATRREFQNLLTDLRLNFVRQQGGGG